MINLGKIVQGINGFRYHLNDRGKVVKLDHVDYGGFLSRKTKLVEYTPSQYTRDGLVDVTGKYTPRLLTEKMIARVVVPYHEYKGLGFGHVEDHAAEGLGYDEFDYIIKKSGHVVEVVDNNGKHLIPYQYKRTKPPSIVNVSGKYYPSRLMDLYYKGNIKLVTK